MDFLGFGWSSGDLILFKIIFLHVFGRDFLSDITCPFERFTLLKIQLYPNECLEVHTFQLSLTILPSLLPLNALIFLDFDWSSGDLKLCSAWRSNSSLPFEGFLLLRTQCISITFTLRIWTQKFLEFLGLHWWHCIFIQLGSTRQFLEFLVVRTPMKSRSQWHRLIYLSPLLTTATSCYP